MTENILVKVCILFALLLLCFSTQARVYSPRVVSEHNADTYSMKTFIEGPRFRNLQGDRKAMAVYSYLTDYDTGLFPMGSGAFEGGESLYEYSLIRDPVKIINVYGVGYCDVFGPVMAGIWQDAGVGAARVVDLPLIDHVAAEVFYNDSWHYLDLDLRAAFAGDDGVLASLQGAKTNGGLWSKPNDIRFFPLDDLSDMQRSFADSEVINRYGVHQSGHTMDFILRQGESFTRWWQPQGDRWLHSVNYQTEPFLIDLLEVAPRGPKSKHPSFSRYTYGNGRFLYQPDLTIASDDYWDGVYDSENLQPSVSGLTLENSGNGYATFEVRTPYVIVPVVGSMTTTEDDYGASVVNVDAVGASYSISLDNGLTWESVQPAGSEIDLTDKVAGEYGYLFRITLSGEPGQAALHSLTMDTWVQLAPASLPSLRAGSNRMEFRTGDHFGLNTRVVEFAPDTASRSDFFRYLVSTPVDYFPESPTSRIRSPFTLSAEAPPNTKIAWFSAGGSFATYQLESALFTEFSMGYSADLPFNFTNLYNADIPSDMEHWHTNAQAEVVLSEPSEVVYVSYQGLPAVNTVQVYAHVVDDDLMKASNVNIIHQWYENGELQSYRTMSDNGVYFIETDSEPTNVSIELSVDSVYLGTPVTGESDTPAADGGSDDMTLVSVGAGVFDPVAVKLFVLLALTYRRLRALRRSSVVF